MNTSNVHDDDTLPSGDNGMSNAGRPDEIVNAATSYLDSGMVDEAEHLLQEVIASGERTPEIQILADRIAEARSIRDNYIVVGSDDTPARQILNVFTRPLPGADTLPRDVQRLVAAAEHDYLAGRLEAALDATMVVSATAPSFLPNFARMAELQIALGDIEAAEELLGTLQLCYELYDRHEDNQLNAIRVALYPDNIDALVQHAQFLLEKRGEWALEPFVPTAIQATVAADPETARQLASAYVELRPDDDEARRGYLRAVVTSGEHDEIVNAFKRHVALNATAPDLLYLRAASLTIEDNPEWINWLDKAAVATRDAPELYPNVRSALDDSERFVTSDKRALSGSVLAIAAGDWETASGTLDRWDEQAAAETAGPVETFVASYARVEIMRHDEQDGLGHALGQSIALALSDAVEPFARESAMFSRPVSPQALLDQLIQVARDRNTFAESIELLERLQDEYPNNLDVQMTLADMLIGVGRMNEGIRKLRSIAQQHERAGNYADMVATMRRMSDAVPTNTEIKSMLVDIYLRRGVLDEALRELEILGELYLTQERRAEAVKAYTRAAEIASTIGDFTRGNELFDRGVAADPENIPVRHAAVAFYLQTGDVARATNQLREVARIMLAQEEPDEAVAALHQIIGLAPNDTDAYHKLGEVLTSMGQYTQAERVYRRLASFTPDDPVLAAKQSALSVLATTH